MGNDSRSMSAAEARQFSTHSIANTIAVESALNCSCEAYRDIFTYNRWKAQGFQVQKGQKAIRLPLVRTVDREDPETGKTETRRVLGRSAVFCRCQVKPIERGA